MEIHRVAPEHRRFSRFTIDANTNANLVSPLRRRAAPRRIAAGNFCLEMVKIDCLARTRWTRKENNISDTKREGIKHESRFNFSRRDRLSEDFAKMHEASCIVCHRENDRHENLGEIYRRDGEMGQGEKKRSRRRATPVYKSVKRVNLMERLGRDQSCYIRCVPEIVYTWQILL